MTKEQFNAEVMFHASIAPFLRMRDSGIISDEDLSVVYTILEEKYRPFFVGNIVSN